MPFYLYNNNYYQLKNVNILFLISFSFWTAECILHYKSIKKRRRISRAHFRRKKNDE